MQRIAQFWNTSTANKIVVGIAILATVGCGCCLMFTALGSVLPNATPTVTSHKAAPSILAPMNNPTLMQAATETPTATATEMPTPTITAIPPTAVPPTIAPTSTNITSASSQPPKTSQATPASGSRIGAVCKDGSTTSVKGSGACSGRGGVDHWLYAP